MREIFILLAVSLVIGCLLLLTGVGAQEELTNDSSLKTTIFPGAEGAPPEVVAHADAWPLPNGDYSNTRATNTSAINSSTVESLAIAWTYPVPEGVVTNPLILNDRVYFQDLNNDITVLHQENGTLDWERRNNVSVPGPNGLAVGWGRIFAAADRYNLTALDARSGGEVWSTRLSERETVTITIQPLLYNGSVFASTVAGGEGVPADPGGGVGVLYALNSDTGEVQWNFSTVDSADIWGNPEVNFGGGTYQPPALDPATGTLFWGIANPGPAPGTEEFPNGASRPGPNLYTNSMLAIGTADGRLRWYTQVHPHDLFNYGIAIPPILARATVNGLEQDIVVGSGKTGRVYAFNRSSGALLWDAVVGTHENDQLAALPPGTTQVAPGGIGGVESAMAYADGIVYAPVTNMNAAFTPESAGEADFQNATGEFVAIEADTGKIRWKQDLASPCIGAATVVNDLVFTGTLGGTVHAFNRTSGEEVWNLTASPGVTGWAAVSGDTMILLGGFNDTPALMALRIGEG